MVRLGDMDISHCTRCGKLFQTEPGRVLCRACNGEIAEAAPKEGVHVRSDAPNFTWQEVYDVLQHAAAQHPPGERPLCVRCRARHALKDSEFCLHCHVALHHDLGEASHALFTQLEVLDDATPEAPPSVTSMLAEKRSRTAMSHINPVVMPRLKKY